MTTKRLKRPPKFPSKAFQTAFEKNYGPIQLLSALMHITPEEWVSGIEILMVHTLMSTFMEQLIIEILDPKRNENTRRLLREKVMKRWGFQEKLDLLKVLGEIGGDVYKGAKKLNEVRNAFVHALPRENKRHYIDETFALSPRGVNLVTSHAGRALIQLFEALRSRGALPLKRP